MAGEEGGRRAERLAGEKEEGDGGTYWIFWRTPEEWAGVLEEWVCFIDLLCFGGFVLFFCFFGGE